MTAAGQSNQEGSMTRCTRTVTVRGAGLTLWLAGAVLGSVSCRDQDIAGPTEEPGERPVGVGFATSATAAATDLGTLGGNTSSATDINANGLIVGYSKTSSGVTH